MSSRPYGAVSAPNGQATLATPARSFRGANSDARRTTLGDTVGCLAQLHDVAHELISSPLCLGLSVIVVVVIGDADDAAVFRVTAPHLGVPATLGASDHDVKVGRAVKVVGRDGHIG
jgi:hypothetical protein